MQLNNNSWLRILDYLEPNLLDFKNCVEEFGLKKFPLSYYRQKYPFIFGKKPIYHRIGSDIWEKISGFLPDLKSFSNMVKAFNLDVLKFERARRKFPLIFGATDLNENYIEEAVLTENYIFLTQIKKPLKTFCAALKFYNLKLARKSWGFLLVKYGLKLDPNFIENRFELLKNKQFYSLLIKSFIHKLKDFTIELGRSGNLCSLNFLLNCQVFEFKNIFKACILSGSQYLCQKAFVFSEKIGDRNILTYFNEILETIKLQRPNINFLLFPPLVVSNEYTFLETAAHSSMFSVVKYVYQITGNSPYIFISYKFFEIKRNYLTNLDVNFIENLIGILGEKIFESALVGCCFLSFKYIFEKYGNKNNLEKYFEFCCYGSCTEIFDYLLQFCPKTIKQTFLKIVADYEEFPDDSKCPKNFCELIKITSYPILKEKAQQIIEIFYYDDYFLETMRKTGFTKTDCLLLTKKVLQIAHLVKKINKIKPIHIECLIKFGLFGLAEKYNKNVLSYAAALKLFRKYLVLGKKNQLRFLALYIGRYRLLANGISAKTLNELF